MFQFTKMLGRSLARRILGVRMKANIVGRFDELRIAEAPVMRTWMQGKTLAQIWLREKAGVTVVGIWEQGKFKIPTAASLVGESTVLVLAGTADQLDQFDEIMGFSGKSSSKAAPVLVLGGGRVGHAVVRNEELNLSPDPEMMLEKTDELVLIGTADSEKRFMEKYPVSEKK